MANNLFEASINGLERIRGFRLLGRDLQDPFPRWINKNNLVVFVQLLQRLESRVTPVDLLLWNSFLFIRIERFQSFGPRLNNVGFGVG